MSYVVKLSSIIQYIKQYVDGDPFLLIVTSCSYISEERAEVMNVLSANRVPPSIINRQLSEQDLFSKYLKYKKKYLNLKKLLN